MDVILPSTGCNIINSATSFYNYSPDSRTRESWVIYEGVAHRQSSTYNQYGYTYSGDCLSTGDLQYQPEVSVYFPILCFCLICFLLYVIYNLIIKRLLP